MKEDVKLNSTEEVILRAYFRRFLKKTKSAQFVNQILNRIFGKCLYCGKPVVNQRGKNFIGSTQLCEYHAEKERQRWHRRKFKRKDREYKGEKT